MMLALVTSIAVVSLVFSTDTVTQQLQGISMKVVIATFQKLPIAAGVAIAVALPRASPLIVIATDIGSTVPPVARAILPSKCTLYIALQQLVAPFKKKIPLSSRCDIKPFRQGMVISRLHTPSI